MWPERTDWTATERDATAPWGTRHDANAASACAQATMLAGDDEPAAVVAFPDELLSTDDVHICKRALEAIHTAAGLLDQTAAYFDGVGPGTHMIALLTGLSGSLLRPDLEIYMTCRAGYIAHALIGLSSLDRPLLLLLGEFDRLFYMEEGFVPGSARIQFITEFLAAKLHADRHA